MPRQIDYYFSLSSPWAYIGHKLFREVVATYDVKVNHKPVVLVEDNGPIHLSKLSLAALAARSHWLTVEWLPKYAPELNDIEVVWRGLKAYHLAHQTFTHADALDQAIHAAVHQLNRERRAVPLANLRISA